MQGVMPLSIRACLNQSLSYPVRQQFPCLRQVAQQQGGSLVIAHLAFGEQQQDRSALAVGDGVQLRVQAALRAADTAGNIPFLSRLAAVR